MYSSDVSFLLFIPKSLRLVHTVGLLLIATVILLIAKSELYRTQWKCSHYATCDNITNSPKADYK